MSGLRRVATVLLIAAGATGAGAQTPPTETVPAAKLEVVTGDGLFELRQGRSLDLTKNQWLLHFPQDNRRENMEAGRISLKISGVGYDLRVGDRIDLKTFHVTMKDVKDRDKCYLDLVDVLVPKGAPAVATFRFHCL